MKSKIFIVLVGLLVLGSANATVADPCSKNLLNAWRGNRVHGIWVHNWNRQRHWSPITRSQVLNSFSVDEFAFIGRTTRKLKDRQGALSVKLLSKSIKGKNGSIDSVLLRRTGPEATCGYRPWILWLLSNIDFLIGKNVSVEDYIKFHATDSDNDGDIKRFHIDYVDRHGDCTNSAAGDKRTAFLIHYRGGPIRGSQVVAAAINRFFDLEAKAGEFANQKKRHVRVPSIIKEQLRKFREYSEIESQVHAYPLDGGPVCVQFSDRYRADSTEIDVVDLDAPRRSRFRRSDKTINWR